MDVGVVEMRFSEVSGLRVVPEVRELGEPPDASGGRNRASDA